MVSQHEYEEREAEQARRDEEMERRRRFAPRDDTQAARDARKISMATHALIERNDGLGRYVPREPGDSAESFLCELLHLMTDGEQGDTWQGPPATND